MKTKKETKVKQKESKVEVKQPIPLPENFRIVEYCNKFKVQKKYTKKVKEGPIFFKEEVIKEFWVDLDINGMPTVPSRFALRKLKWYKSIDKAKKMIDLFAKGEIIHTAV